jgi:hypothetical protein
VPTAFRNYFDLDDVRLELPIGEKTYTIPPITAPAGARLETNEDIPDEEFFELTLGAALAEMRADGVKPEAIARAALTSITNHRDGRDVAVIMWETNALPERLAAYMAAHQPASPDSTQSPNSAEADETQSPASTSGTTSRPATRRKPQSDKASPSAGSKSSARSTS